MEIDSIPEVEEENEAERSESNASNINLAFNRVETEYCDDDQSFDISSIEEIFTNLIHESLVISLSLLFLISSLCGLSHPMLPFVPPAAFEMLGLFKNCLGFKNELPVLTKFWKSDFLLKAFENFCNFVGFVLVGLIVNGEIFQVFWVVLPLVLRAVLRICLRVNFVNNCVSFTEFVRGCILWINLGFFSLLATKLDLQLKISWTLVYTPFFILSGISTLVIFVSLSLVLINICSKEKDLTYIYSNIWLQYTMFNIPFTFLLLYYNFSIQSPLWLLSPIFSLFIFSFLTNTLKKNLALTWWEFFISESLTQHQVFDESPLPLPCSQKLYIETSLKNKIVNVIKLTPRVLTKFPKTQAQNIGENRKRKKMNRTLSQSIEVNVTSKTHVRSRSSCIAGINFDNALNCKFCNKNTAINKFQDCGHGELCNPCAEMYIKAKRKCYVCQEHITGFLQDTNKTFATENSKRKIDQV